MGLPPRGTKVEDLKCPKCGKKVGECTCQPEPPPQNDEPDEAA